MLIPEDAESFAAYCERETVWPAESLRRRTALLPQIEASLAAPGGGD